MIPAATSHSALYSSKEFEDTSMIFRSRQNIRLLEFPKYSYLNLGCLLMASSGKKRDFEAPPSTGVGL